jgi:SNF2 family DNA or RNA helicase
MIMSVRAGAGLDGLQRSCRTVVVGELDWSPKVHDQAIGRVHRDGQRDPVLAYLMVSAEGSDPVVADVLGLKEVQAAGVIGQEASLFRANDSGDHIRKLAQSILDKRGRPREAE